MKKIKIKIEKVKNNYNFKNKVIKIVAKIPSGKTLSYKEVAKLAGSPKAYRAVGNILNKYYKDNFSDKYSFPCHRVIRSDGGFGDYAGGNKQKAKLLNKERSQ
jgi:methylated-DNA-[protein]-cysteine S-methyltransferase